MKYFNKKAEIIIRNKITSENKKINVIPGKCRYNFRCSFNSVHEASKNNHKKIAMVVYIEDGFPIVHFVNYHKGKFIDNTLGEWSSQYEYYFIRFIKKDEMWDVGYIFNRYRATLQNYLPFWTKLLNTQTF